MATTNWAGVHHACAPESDELAPPSPFLPGDLVQDDAPRAGAILAEEVGCARHKVRLHGVRVCVPHRLGCQRAGRLPLLQGLPPHRLLPLAGLHQPYLR